MQTDAPCVSVVLPVKNGEPFLEPAVGSIIAQTFNSWELIAVDDGSTDATAAILLRMAAADPRIRVLSSGGAGIVDALNLGISASRAQLIARMDADDIAMPERLALQFRFMADNPSVVASGSSALTIDKNGVAIGKMAMPVDPDSIGRQLHCGNAFIHPTMVMRKAAVLSVGLYRPGCAFAEDYDLWLRMEETGALANLPDVTLLFRVHRAQTSKTKRFQQRAAASLARQVAWRRRENRSEGADMGHPLEECCAQFLSMCADDPTAIAQTDAKDVAVMLRLVHLRLPEQTVLTLVRRLQREGKFEKHWLLRLRLASARIRNMLLFPASGDGGRS